MLPDVFERNAEIEKNYELVDGSYVVDLGNSSISWRGSKSMVPGYAATGNIELKSGKLRVEDDLLKSGEFVANMQSINVAMTGTGSGMDDLAEKLRSDVFFDAENFPEAKFSLKSIAPSVTRDRVLMNGDFIIKDISNFIEFEAEVFMIEQTNTIKLIGKVLLDRTLWDIQYGSDKFFDNLGDNVIDDIFEVEVEITGIIGN